MKTKWCFAFVAISLLGLLLIGCESPAITSRRANPSDEGFVYCLPVGKVHIVATRQDFIYTNYQSTIIITNITSVATNVIQYQVPSIPQTSVSSQTQSSTFIGTNSLTSASTNINISTNYTSSSMPQIVSNSLVSQITLSITSPPPLTS